MIHEEICTYEVAKLAKGKGFPQLGIDSNNYWFEDNNGELIDMNAKAFVFDVIPKEGLTRKISQSLLQRWLREEKNIHIEIIATASGYYWCVNKTNGTSITDSDVLDRGTNEGGCFDTYEPALEDALKYALEKLV